MFTFLSDLKKVRQKEADIHKQVFTNHYWDITLVHLNGSYLGWSDGGCAFKFTM